MPANNTPTPSANGVIGLLEGYTVMDLSAEYKFLKITILDLELIT
jgi:Fe(3+) dicitrate transport protein